MNELVLNNVTRANIRQLTNGGFAISCTNSEGLEFEINLDPVKDENLKLTFGED